MKQITLKELVEYFEQHMIDDIDIINVISDVKCEHYEYERLKRNFVKLFEEVFFTLSENDKHNFEVLAFDKYCNYLEYLGL